MQDYLYKLAQYIQTNFPKRHTAEEKKFFRKFIVDTLSQSSWSTDDVTAEGHILTKIKSRPKVIFTAHFDTGNRISFISFIQKCIGHNREHLFLILPFIVSICALVLTIFIPALFAICGIITILCILLFSLYIIIPSFFLLVKPNPINMNDNTSGVLVLLGLANKLSIDDVQFVFFDQEEKFCKRSKAFNKMLKKLYPNEYDKIQIINFDCVGVGDILIVSHLGEKSSSSAKLSSDIVSNLKMTGTYQILEEKQFSNSDYRSFEENPSISFSFTKEGLLFGHYIPNMHTPKDTYLELDNLVWLVENIAHRFQ